jgi:hypothetical protein
MPQRHSVSIRSKLPVHRLDIPKKGDPYTKVCLAAITLSRDANPLVGQEAAHKAYHL